jgi:hypothetical protein
LDEPLPVLKTKPKILTVFKNGLGFFIREGTSDLKNGWAFTEEVPAAALGTLWVTSLEPGSPVEETVSAVVELEKETPAGSLEALLAANVGKKVILTANNQAFEGVIKAAPGNIVILATSDREDIVLNKGSIQNRIPQRHVISILPGPNQEDEVQARWPRPRPASCCPICKASLGSRAASSISRTRRPPDDEATLVNDVETWTASTPVFVVGYPGFRFADVLADGLGQAMAHPGGARPGGEGTSAQPRNQRHVWMAAPGGRDYGSQPASVVSAPGRPLCAKKSCPEKASGPNIRFFRTKSTTNMSTSGRSRTP